MQVAGSMGNSLFLQSGTTGMVLVLVRDDQVFFRGYGQTAPNSGKAPTGDSVVRLCSLTKIFTSDLLTKLVLDKTVRLDDPLQRYAPPHVVVPRRDGTITLKDLATHTSGLPRELAHAPRATPHFTYPNRATRWRWLGGQHLASVPGTEAAYSNLGYDFLGDALETAGHKQYAALLAERTLNPLNMRQTTYYPNAVQCGRLMLGVNDQGPCTATDETAGSSGLYSTAADMAVWLKYLLGSGGPSLPAQDPAAQAEYVRISDLKSQKGLDHVGHPTGIGLGWLYLLRPSDPEHILQKTGGGAGFSTYIAINPARHTAIFFAATDGAMGWQVNLFEAADDILLAMAGLPPMPPEPPRPTVKHAHKSPHRRRKVLS
jgi:D-alanyl-D-alanine-carboxypeptidase/D-alanyl-D-alanine-endopeptidase